MNWSIMCGLSDELNPGTPAISCDTRQSLLRHQSLFPRRSPGNFTGSSIWSIGVPNSDVGWGASLSQKEVPYLVPDQ
jgi:hypothetical protein